MDKKPIQVLLLEDEAAHVEAIRRALETKNNAFKLQVVGSLRKYREHLAALQPDIALLDMVLPDGNGIDLLSSPPESNAFPMLILTSHGNEQAAVAALKAGALDYIIKSPETFTNMPRILTGALNQWNMLLSHKKAERALEISEQNFHSSLENSPLGIRIVSEDGETLYTNRAFLNIYGYKNIEEFKTTPVKDRYTPGSYLEFHERRGKRRRSEPLPDNYEVNIIRKDGAVRHLQVIRKEILWGGKLQYQTIYQDITERKQAEEALRDRIKELQMFYSFSAIIEREGITLDELCQELTNLLPNSWQYPEITCARITISEKTFCTKNFQESPWVQSTAIKVNKATAGRIDIGYLDRKPEKDEGPFLKEERRLLDAIAERLGHVTGRKWAEDILQSMTIYQGELLAAIPDIIMEVDNNKIYTWTNQVGRDFFGDDVIGKEAAFYFEGEQDTYDVVKPLFSGQEETFYVESWQRRRDGQKRLLAWWCRVLKDNKGNVKGALSTAQDITERKKIEDALAASEVSYRRLFESAKDGILIIDAVTGLITDANPFLNNLLLEYKPG